MIDQQSWMLSDLKQLEPVAQTVFAFRKRPDPGRLRSWLLSFLAQIIILMELAVFQGSRRIT